MRFSANREAVYGVPLKIWRFYYHINTEQEKASKEKNFASEIDIIELTKRTDASVWNRITWIET